MTFPREEKAFTCKPCSVALEPNAQKNQEVPDAPWPEQPGSTQIHFAVSAVRLIRDRARTTEFAQSAESRYQLVTSFILVKRIVNVL
mgnify:CR=1 FL=1